MGKRNKTILKKPMNSYGKKDILIHETSKEAEAETLNMLNIYNNFFHDYLAIPSIVGRKTEKEKFAGAEYTYTVESLMYNGIALQSATSHYFGQKFSKAYDIKFTSREIN